MSSLRRAIFAIVAAGILAAAVPAEAQYFGRNKVRYRTFKFQVLKTAHFDVYYYPEERLAVEQAAQMAERWYARLSKILNHELSTRQPLILYSSHPDFEQTNAIEGELGEGTGGVTEVLKRRIVLPLAGPLAESDHVLGHELVHAFQFDITGHAGPVSEGSAPGALRLPLWFIEGMAEYLSLGPVDPHTAMWMRDAVRQAQIDERNKEERLPSIRDLDDPRFFPYRWGQAFWAYVAGRWGDPIVGRMLRAAARANDLEPVVSSILGVDSKQLSEDWHAALREVYLPLVASKQSASRYGPAVITDKNGGELNVGPSLSPDGRRMIFLSSKSLFSIEMFLADAATGRVERRIVKTSADPHFDSLQFINSAGGWDRAGRRFAFGAVRKGTPVLTILDVDRGRTEREIRFEQLGEIFDPTWSPDGRRIAFVALVGGLMDLFIYDLQSGALKRATDDAFAELQPVWSPDGRRIAFVTDRFTTQLETLATGDYRLATIDPDSGAIAPLPGFENAKNIDPQWSDDGVSLYFISDRNGISNVYRLTLDGAISQVTDLLTGVSGITSLSPALSFGGGRLVYSAYEAEKHAIYAVNDARILAGFPPTQESALAAALPPLERRRAEVAALRENPMLGLPDRRRFGTADYKAKLALDYVGQPSVGIGTDPFGTYVGGSVALLFSDMLGNHTVGTSLQIQGSLDDFGGVVFYQNRKHRWDWGAALQQIPYISGGYDIGEGVVNGVPVFIQRTLLDRQIDRNVTAFAAYPFNRAHRFELSAAARRISFKNELRTEYFDINTGQFLGREKEKLPSADALNLAEGGAALVYDTSIFGATGPILGRRYRLEVTPTFGTVQYTGVLADVRQYVMPVRPYTLAARVIHYGRYGNGAEDERFFPLFLGYPQLIRGYDYNSFSADECGVTADGSCPVFDQLLGSRLLLGNVELRFPPFGAFGGRSFYGPIPLELVAFADAGVAWTRNEKAQFLSGGTRKWVKSVGAGARINLFGYAVVEIDYVKPLDRPRKGWIWQFNFSPGW